MFLYLVDILLYGFQSLATVLSARTVGDVGCGPKKCKDAVLYLRTGVHIGRSKEPEET